jgi:hypothetical protein
VDSNPRSHLRHHRLEIALVIVTTPNGDTLGPFDDRRDALARL